MLFVRIYTFTANIVIMRLLFIYLLYFDGISSGFLNTVSYDLLV